MENIKYYKFESDDNSFYFDNLDTILDYINDTLKQEVLNYYCQGCRWCCYGTPSYQANCEITFTEYPKDFKRWFDISYIRNHIFMNITEIRFEKDKENVYHMNENIIWTLDENFDGVNMIFN